MLCFCRRGRQNLRQLKKSHFRVFKDASGKKYVAKVVDELTKNHRENDKEEEAGMIPKVRFVPLRVLKNIYNI